MVLKWFSIVLYCCYCTSILGQFTGGPNDGYDLDNYTSLENIFLGSAKDGYAASINFNTKTIFSGGAQSNTYYSLYTNSINVFKGTAKDGYASKSEINPISIFNGNDKGGYNASLYSNSTNIFSGSEGDGYDIGSKILRWMWVGLTNNNWNNATNWSTSTIPNLNSKVIIQSGVPHFPILVGGELNIGKGDSSGDYMCRSLDILTGADISLDINAYLYNFGKVTVSGNLNTYNQISGSLTNEVGGIFIIKALGQVVLH